MRTRMYGGVRGRKTKVGGKSTFVFLLLDLCHENVRERELIDKPLGAVMGHEDTLGR